MAVLIILFSIFAGLSLTIFFVLIMSHFDMRAINRNRFNNFNERRTIGVDEMRAATVFIKDEKFLRRNFEKDILLVMQN